LDASGGGLAVVPDDGHDGAFQVGDGRAQDHTLQTITLHNVAVGSAAVKSFWQAFPIDSMGLSRCGF
jgi:hypothetical protein